MYFDFFIFYMIYILNYVNFVCGFTHAWAYTISVLCFISPSIRAIFAFSLTTSFGRFEPDFIILSNCWVFDASSNRRELIEAFAEFIGQRSSFGSRDIITSLGIFFDCAVPRICASRRAICRDNHCFSWGLSVISRCTLRACLWSKIGINSPFIASIQAIRDLSLSVLFLSAICVSSACTFCTASLIAGSYMALFAQSTFRCWALASSDRARVSCWSKGNVGVVPTSLDRSRFHVMTTVWVAGAQISAPRASAVRVFMVVRCTDSLRSTFATFLQFVGAACARVGSGVVIPLFAANWEMKESLKILEGNFCTAFHTDKIVSSHWAKTFTPHLFSINFASGKPGSFGADAVASRYINALSSSGHAVRQSIWAKPLASTEASFALCIPASIFSVRASSSFLGSDSVMTISITHPESRSRKSARIRDK